MSWTRGLGGAALAAVLAACGGGPDASAGGAGGAAAVAVVSASSASQTSSAGPSTSSSVGAGTGGSVPELPRADQPGIACTDTLTDVYVTPSPLPTMTDGARGDIVRCATDQTLSVTDVSAAVAAKGIQTPMTSGVHVHRVAFRTERGDGSAGVSTARVYLPTTPRALPLPVVVIGHPTDGIADACAPSLDPSSNQDLALPWAGLGYAVVVPDYAGLGNEGVQAYLDNRDQGQAILDGARALRKLLSKGALSSDILAVGFSQGGGAVLSAQALAKTYGADGELVAAIVFAPEWPTRMNSFGFVDMLRNPTELTILTGISENVVAVMRTYGYFFNRVGPTHGGDGFPAATRSDILGAVDALCQTPLGGWLQANAVHVGDIFDEGLRTSLLACIDGQGQGAGCVEPGKGYYDFLSANVLAADPTGARVLYVQGLVDYVMPAPSEAACNLEKLAADGVTPQLCVDPLAQHETVVARNMDFALSWGLAALAHDALPTCSSAGMPPCVP